MLVNPFIFPSELTFYFILMLVSLSAPAFSLAFSIIMFFTHPSFSLQFSFYSLVVFPLLTLVLLPFLTFFFYNRGIKTKIKKYGKNRLEDRYPEILKLLSRLCQQMQLKTPNSFYIDNEQLNALAFGSREQAYVLISSGLCEKLGLFPNLVETVLAHELSHLKNRDVVPHELAESLWRSFAIVTAISSICGLTANVTNYDQLFGWSMLVLFIYLVPFSVIFYLNNVIERWREIYADVRTTFLQGSNINLINSIRLFSPMSKSSSREKLFSPFVLTPGKRLKIIQQDVFQHIVERGMIGAVIAAISWFSVLFSVTFLFSLWNVVGGVPSEWVTVVWFLIVHSIFSVMCLPFWALSLKRIQNTSQYFLDIFMTPLKVNIILGSPVILMLLLTGQMTSQLTSSFEPSFYFFVITYVFLLAHRLIFHFILSFVSLNVSIRTKVLFSELVLFIFPMGLSLYFLDLVEPLYAYAGAISILILLPILLFLVKKYSKCPYCHKDVKLSSLLKCTNCSNSFNQELFVTLKN